VRGEPPTMRRGRRTPRPQLPRLVQERPAHRVIVVTVASGEAGGDEGEVEDAEEEEGEQVCRVLILCRNGTLLKCGRGPGPTCQQPCAVTVDPTWSWSRTTQKRDNISGGGEGNRNKLSF
jgi:hypothetical protein